MKLYDCTTAPSARRVRIFLAEKGVDIPTVQVDLRAGEHLRPAYRAINPDCTVPCLELDDGTAIAESVAICQYIEEIHPEPPLMGVDARDRALVTMWNRRAEFDGFLAVAEAFRNSSKGFKDRAVTGAENEPQIPELAERGRRRVARFLAMLDRRLGESEFLAGPRYTIADITALAAVDFAGWMKVGLAPDQANAQRWHAAVSARPSAKA